MAYKTNSSANSHPYANLCELVGAIKTSADAVFRNEPQDIQLLRTGNLKIGTNNQYYSTWVIADGMIRDLAATWYSLLRTFEDNKFSLDQCCVLVERFDYNVSNFLRYSGFPEMGGFAYALIKHLPTASTRHEANNAVREFLKYLNGLTAWSFHYFPWNLGSHLTYTDEGRCSAADPSRRVHVTDGVKIRLNWEPLNISVVALIATNQNPELSNEILNALPLNIIMDHAVVSGKSMYGWVPIVSTSPIRVKERQCDAPIGRLRFSQGTGQKIVVQYGQVTEDVETPVLGEVLPEFVRLLAIVGDAVLKSTMETKEIIQLSIELDSTQTNKSFLAAI